jgi:hypothetical protein
MTKRFRLALVLLILAAISCGAAWIYVSKRAFAGSDDDQDKQSTQAKSHVSVEGGKTVLKFNQADQHANGIAVVTLNSSQQRLTVQGTGTILQVQPFLDLKTSFNTAQMDLAKAHAVVQASQAEYRRLVKLNQDGVNASAKSVEAAKATAESDAASLRNAEQSIVLLKDSVRLRWNGDIAGWLEHDSSQFKSVLSGREFLLQVAPAGTPTWTKPPAEIMVGLPDGSRVPAHLWSTLPQVDPRLQTPNFLYGIAPHPGILPGSNLSVFLPTGSTQQGIVVPNGAVVWWQGRAWCYIEHSPGKFIRQEVNTSNPVPNGWFVTGGIPAGTRVATAGAQTLLSTEFQPQIQMDED